MSDTHRQTEPGGDISWTRVGCARADRSTLTVQYYTWLRYR